MDCANFLQVFHFAHQAIINLQPVDLSKYKTRTGLECTDLNKFVFIYKHEGSVHLSREPLEYKTNVIFGS